MGRYVSDGEMKSGDERQADYYRQMAAEITGLAGKSHDLAIRRELLDLAERFRRLAAYVEGRKQNNSAPS
jgi:ribosomal protein S15P/S13E